MKKRLKGRIGKVFAGLIGGLFFALTSSVFCSIFYPADPFDRMFAGGLLFGPIWVGAGLFAYHAPSTFRAWLRVVIPALIFFAGDVYGLMYMAA